MLSRRCNMTKAIIRAMRVAPVQLIIKSLARQFTAPQIISIILAPWHGSDNGLLFQ